MSQGLTLIKNKKIEQYIRKKTRKFIILTFYIEVMLISYELDSCIGIISL